MLLRARDWLAWAVYVHTPIQFWWPWLGLKILPFAGNHANREGTAHG